MTIKLRPGQERDRAAILGLMRPGDYNRVNLQPACFLVAEAQEAETEGTVVGIGQVKRHWDGTPELASLVVAQAYRRQGIGGKIVQALVERHRQAHPSAPLYLFCLQALEPYYAGFGFQPVARATLPWPLWTMHRLGNSLGRLVKMVGGPVIEIIAMKREA